MDVVDSAVDGGAESALMEDEAEPEDSGIVVPHLHQPAPRRHCTCALRHGLRSLRQWWGTREVLALCRLAIPIVVMLFFQQLLFLISLLFVGHITGESLELDAAALGYSFVNVTGILIGIGLATAADTLCSQTYGFKDYKGVGVILQRGLLILAVTMFPIWVLWLNTESVLLLLRQPPCVARIAAQYVKVFCLALPFIFLYTMLQKYLQAQGIVWIFVLVGLGMNVVGAAFHGILIYAAELGVIGSAIAMVISYSSAPLLLLVYTYLRQLHHQTWGGWSWEGLKGWGQFARLGVPGLMMIIFEWCSIEVSAFVAGAIDQTQLAINAVLITVLNVVYMIPLGISIAVTIRVGNELGAGNSVGAKRASYATIAVVMCNSIITCTVLLSIKTVLGKFFTEDQAVIEGVSKVVTVVAFMEFSDGIQAAVAGILRGSGRQLFGAVVNFLSYFVLGLPLAVVLALPVGLGTLGIWVALAGANFIQAIVFLVAVWRTDWERQAQRAQKEAKAVGKQEPAGVPQGEGGGEGEGGEWQREGSHERDIELEAKSEDTVTTTSTVLEEDMNRTAEEDALLQETEDLPRIQSSVLEEDTAEEDALLQETEDLPRVQASVLEEDTAEEDALLQETEDAPRIQTSVLEEDTAEEDALLQETEDAPRVQSSVLEEDTAEEDALLQETEDAPRVQSSVLEEDTAEEDALLQETEDAPRVQASVLEEDTAEEDALLQETEDAPRVQSFHRTCCSCGLRLQLLLYRGSFFLAGVALLVAGGVASQHLHYPLADLSNCSNSSGDV